MHRIVEVTERVTQNQNHARSLNLLRVVELPPFFWF